MFIVLTHQNANKVVHVNPDLIGIMWDDSLSPGNSVILVQGEYHNVKESIEQILALRAEAIEELANDVRRESLT